MIIHHHVNKLVSNELITFNFWLEKIRSNRWKCEILMLFWINWMVM
jgi:hypothetical protein